MFSLNLKKFLNSIKCPICNAQIDTLTNNIPPYRDFDFCCAESIYHYAIKVDDEYIPKIISELVNIYDDKHNYNILKTMLHVNKFKTEITINDIDQEGRLKFSFSTPRFVTELNIFDFQNFNSEKAINRIKTILVFQ